MSSFIRVVVVMAEGFEPYHVPQQSRRDKLRVVSLQQQQSSQPACAVGLVPVFDHHPSLISSDLITCVDLHNHTTATTTTNHSYNNKRTSSSNPITVCNSKGEGHVNLMGYVGGGGLITASSSSSSSPSATNHLYMDPHSSSTIQLNPSSIQDHVINNNSSNSNPFLFNSTHHEQGLRFLDQSFHGGEVMGYRPEPLSSVAHEQQHSNINNINTTCVGGQGLSLSLSSSNHSSQQGGGGSHQLPLELNLQQRYDSSTSMYSTKVINGGCFIFPPPPPPSGDASASINELLLSRNDVVAPLGPFIGYASILKGSRFLRPAQQLLDELSDVGRGFYSDKIAPDQSVLLDPPLESFCATGIVDDPKTCSVGGETRRKKSRLMSMLDEVYKRYKQYYQQMQAVVASFESVSGVRNAAPFANLALKAMSKHFRYLKNAITDQLQFITESRGHHVTTREKDTAPVGFENHPGGMEIQSQSRIQNVGFVEHHHHHHHQPVWRPQRGLPERAVTVLRAWLFEHFLHPYPTDTDKIMLAKQTGLSRNQVSNWFINARVRLWKPMVEEIHMLETRQGQKASQKELNNAVSAIGNAVQPSGKKLGVTPSSNQRIEEFPSKRTRNDLPAAATGFPAGNEQSMNLTYDHHNSSRPPCFSSGGGGTGGVSLTLGLHQNNGIGLADPFPMNAARRFGLDANSDGYVNMAGINEAQNQQFRREIIGGQLLHDFVG